MSSFRASFIQDSQSADFRQQKFPYDIAENGKTYSAVLDIDSEGNSVFGHYTKDYTYLHNDQMFGGGGSGGFLAYYTASGIMNWFYIFKPTFDDGSGYYKTSSRDADFSPDGQRIFVNIELHFLYSCLAILQSSDASVIESLTIHVGTQYFQDLAYSKTLILANDYQGYILSRNEVFRIGRVDFEAQTLTNYQFSSPSAELTDGSTCVTSSVREGSNNDMYLGATLSNAQNYALIGLFDMDTPRFTKLFTYLIDSQFGAIHLSHISVYSDGDDTFIGSCLSKTGGHATLGFQLDSFDALKDGTSKLYRIDFASNVDCKDVNAIDSETLIFSYVQGNKFYIGKFDKSDESQIFEKKLLTQNEVSTKYQGSRIISEDAIYYTGYTKWKEVGFEDYFQTGVFHAYLMKLDQSQSAILLSYETNYIPISFQYPTEVWDEKSTIERGLTTSSVAVVASELTIIDIKFWRFMSSPGELEPEVVSPINSDITYYVGDAEQSTPFTGFQIDGEELVMTYTGMLSGSSDALPSCIEINSDTREFVIFTEDDAEIGTYDITITGIQGGGASKIFDITVRIKGTLTVDMSFSSVTMPQGEVSFHSLPEIVSESGVPLDQMEYKAEDLPSFMSLSSGVLIGNPGMDVEPGVYIISVSIGPINGDFSVTQTYSIVVEVTSSDSAELSGDINQNATYFLPRFNPDPVTSFSIGQGQTQSYELPEIVSANPVTLELVHYNNSENLIILKNNILTMDAKDAEVANYSISLIMTDTVLNLTTAPIFMTVSVTGSAGFQVHQERREEDSIHIISNDEDPELREGLEAAIISVTENGLVYIEFSADLVTGTDIDAFLELLTDTLKVEILSIAGIESTQDIQFSPQAISYSDKVLVIDLQLENPLDLQITNSETFDIQITFLQRDLLFSEDGNYLNEESMSLEEEVPTQLADDKLSTSIIEVTGDVETALSVLTAAGFASTLILSVSLSYMFAFINILQITTHLPLISEYMPSNLLYMFTILLDIANFNFIPYETFNEKLFEFPENGALNNQFDQTGYGNMLFVQNLSSIFYYILVIIALTILKFAFYVAKAKNRVSKKLNGVLTKSFCIKFINETYLEFILCSVINLFDLTFSGFSVASSNIFLLATFIIVQLFPCYIIRQIYLYKKQTEEERKRSSSKTGLFDSLDLSKESSAYTPLLFILQRYLFVTICFFVVSSLQVQAFSLVTLLMVSYYIYCFPYQEKGINRVEIFNAFCIHLTVLHLLLFQDFIEDAETKYMVGWSVVFLTLFVIFANNLVIVAGFIKEIRNKVNAYCKKRRANTYKIQKNPLKIDNENDIEVQDIEKEENFERPCDSSSQNLRQFVENKTNVSYNESNPNLPWLPYNLEKSQNLNQLRQHYQQKLPVLTRGNKGDDAMRFMDQFQNDAIMAWTDSPNIFKESRRLSRPKRKKIIENN